MIPKTVDELIEVAQKVRRYSIEMIYRAGSGHPGSCLSSADILTSLYYGGVISYDHRNPTSEKRDRFILSNGHAAPVWYAILAEAGFYDVKDLGDLRNLGSKLQGHPSRVFAEFVETSTGSLGQGLSVGVGIAMGLKLKVKSDKVKVIVMCSDGEEEEGAHWEAVMLAGQKKLGNLCLIVDQNGMQIGGKTSDIIDLGPVEDKYKAFGWEVFLSDGHSYPSLLSNFSRFNEGKKPKVVICKTVRGKGVSFMEGSPDYHAKALTEDEYQRAIAELSS